jgi:hypothetical protein
VAEPRPVKITPTEAARLIGCSPRTLERWRRDRVGPPFFKPLIGRPFYLLSDLDAWLAATERVQTYPIVRQSPQSPCSSAGLNGNVVHRNNSGVD